MHRRDHAPTAVMTALLALLLAVGLVVPPAAAAELPASFDPATVFIHNPPGLRERPEPLTVVIALHGMGAEGRGFCQSFLAAADRNGWVVVAPTFRYRNWRDPATVAEDDLALTRQLASLLTQLPERIGHPTKPRAVLLGFSRGAQLAHRFALAFPERTRAVAAMSAGTYTLPTDRLSDLDPMASRLFPFGTADLASRLGGKVGVGQIGDVDFWVAVGADDNQVDDVPRQWDALLGKTRVQRARRFGQALWSAGANTELVVYQNLGHAMSADMVRGATDFVERTARPGGAEWSTGPLGAHAY